MCSDPLFELQPRNILERMTSRYTRAQPSTRDSWKPKASRSNRFELLFHKWLLAPSTKLKFAAHAHSKQRIFSGAKFWIFTQQVAHVCCFQNSFFPFFCSSTQQLANTFSVRAYSEGKPILNACVCFHCSCLRTIYLRPCRQASMWWCGHTQQTTRRRMYLVLCRPCT